MSDEAHEAARSPEQIATDIRDAVDELNRLLREAAEHGCRVEVEVTKVPLLDHVALDATNVRLAGVFKRVEPEPRPAEVPPARPKRPAKG